VYEISKEEWDRVLEVNLGGAFHCVRAAVPYMMQQRYGRIVNISSLAARVGSRVAGAHYAASKGGLLGLTKTLSTELGPYHIRVNAICPGRIITPMMELVPPEVNERMAQETPLRRNGTAEEVADLIIYLLSDLSSFVSGATIDINGARLPY